MQKLIISAPFGNYFRQDGVTSTLGTYTLYQRAGVIKRLYRILSTVRYYRRPQAWINQLGLPNPGIEALDTAKNHILSIQGFNQKEWYSLAQKAAYLEADAIEFNLSCPNIEHKCQILDIKLASEVDCIKIAKLPPVRWMDWGEALWDLGFCYFHLCNTIPSPGGGISGKPLKQYSLWAINDFRDRWGDEVIIIGGGGITDISDIDDYLKAGANHISIGSTLLNPFNWWKVKFFRDYLSDEQNRKSRA